MTSHWWRRGSWRFSAAPVSTSRTTARCTGGPYTIVQDLANQRFAIDHRQPYSGGGQGQVEIVVGPQSDGVRGAVRSRDTNLINYNGPLTSCTFNTAPVPPLGLK